MLMTESRLRSLIRTLLEADAAPGTPNPMDTPVQKTETEKAAEREAASPGKADFDDDLAALLAKKMKDKGASESSINDMKRTVQDGV